MKIDTAFRFLIPTVALALLAGCGRRETVADAGVRTQTLHVALKAEPRDLDPHIATSQEEFMLTKALMEGLTELDPKTARPIPGVAERWEISADANSSMIGRTVDVLVDEEEGEKGLFIGRTQSDAPEVDGAVYVRGRGIAVGDMCRVRLTDAMEYDLTGEVA